MLRLERALVSFANCTVHNILYLDGKVQTIGVELGVGFSSVLALWIIVHLRTIEMIKDTPYFCHLSYTLVLYNCMEYVRSHLQLINPQKCTLPGREYIATYYTILCSLCHF